MRLQQHLSWGQARAGRPLRAPGGPLCADTTILDSRAPARPCCFRPAGGRLCAWQPPQTPPPAPRLPPGTGPGAGSTSGAPARASPPPSPPSPPDSEKAARPGAQDTCPVGVSHLAEPRASLCRRRSCSQASRGGPRRGARAPAGCHTLSRRQDRTSVRGPPRTGGGGLSPAGSEFPGARRPRAQTHRRQRNPGTSGSPQQSRPRNRHRGPEGPVPLGTVTRALPEPHAPQPRPAATRGRARQRTPEAGGRT